MSVRDPAFWRRFSVAVHQDEESQRARAASASSNSSIRPDLKHSYVSPSSPPQSETQQQPRGVKAEVEVEVEILQESYESGSPLLPMPATARTAGRPDTLNWPLTAPRSPVSQPQSPYPEDEKILASPAPSYPHPSSTSPPPSRAHPQSHSQSQSSHPSRPRRLSKPKRGSNRSFYRNTRLNASNLTLGLSNRPASRGFKFWTDISADPGNRESWLEEQRRKKSKRTCMCWGFWLVFAALVAGIVVAVVLLRNKGII